MLIHFFRASLELLSFDVVKLGSIIVSDSLFSNTILDAKNQKQSKFFFPLYELCTAATVGRKKGTFELFVAR